jgi:hypothetical protein
MTILAMLFLVWWFGGADKRAQIAAGQTDAECGYVATGIGNRTLYIVPVSEGDYAGADYAFDEVMVEKEFHDNAVQGGFVFVETIGGRMARL